MADVYDALDDRFGWCGYDVRNLVEMKMKWRPEGQERWNYWLYYAQRRGPTHG